MGDIVYLAPPVKGIFQAVDGAPQLLPLFMDRVQAGFPSPAEGYIEGKLDLNRHLIKHPAATYYVRVKGDSMIGAGIYDGDMLVVDRSLQPASGNIILAVLDGSVTVKRLVMGSQECLLMPENPKYQPIRLRHGNELQVWGVATHVIHILR